MRPPPDDDPAPPRAAPGDSTGGSDAAWDRVHALFHEALERAPAEREALLARVAHDEPDAVAEVRSLLATHLEASGFLDAPPVSPFVSTLGPGDRLGPYRIVELVGRGGMGVVYRAARDDENFTKDVAIKLIDPGMRSDEILRRFRAERQILAMLDHPNIARLLDGGSTADSGPYVVMEFVAGRPLTRWCDDRALPIEERLNLFLTVCHAVQFAHQRLVVHRDLKSDNILVTDDGSPRLLDFGIAKLLAPEGADRDVTRTAPVHRMLTPDYASPEQVRGEPTTVASDVYSLGVVLYELLTGERPLRFTTRSPEEILRVVAETEPAPPSTVAARATTEDTARRRGLTTARLRRRLSGDLDDIVLRALEKDPARRYGSVELFAQDLRRHLRGLPVLARGRSTAYRLSRFARRHRAAIGAAALVTVSLVAGLVGTAWQARIAREERDRATRRFEDVRALAHAVVFDIHDAIANLPGSTKARETLVLHALTYLDTLSREAQGDRRLQRELALAYMKVGDVQGRPMFPNLGRPADALRSYERADTLLAEVLAALPDSDRVAHERLMVLQRRADMFYVLGKPKESLAATLRTREFAAAWLRKRPDSRMFLEDYGVSTGRLVDRLRDAADTLGAMRECEANLQIAERLFRLYPEYPEHRRSVLINSSKLADFHSMLGHRDSALAAYGRGEALALEAVRLRPDNTDARRDLSVVYGMEGLFLAESGRIDSAVAVYERGHRIAEALAAADPASVQFLDDVAVGHYELGTILVAGRRWPEALARFERAWEAFGRVAALDPDNAEGRTQQARSARAAGEACLARAAAADADTDRARWRADARTWLERSRAGYVALAAAGALTGEETAAPAELARLLASAR